MKIYFLLAVLFSSLFREVHFVQHKQRTESAIHKQTPGPDQIFSNVKYNGKMYQLCEVDPHKYSIELLNVLQNGKENSFQSIASQKKKGLVFVCNGGMFEPDFGPVGLFISEGKTYKSINMKDGNGNFYNPKPNGVFMMDKNSHAKIITSENYVKVKPNAWIATQSGPMLLINRTIHPLLPDPSSYRYIRNGVGINKNNKIVFVLSQDPITLHEFARFFKEKLACENALYLDGAISQTYIPEMEPTPKIGSPLGVFIIVSKKI